MKPSLVINAISNWTSIGVSIITSFVLTPFIIFRLGNSGYGIWVLVLSIVGYYGLLDLGLHSATIRYVARYVGQGDKISLNRTINTSVTIFFYLGVSVVFISFLLADPLAIFFQIHENQALEFRHMVWLVGGAAGLGFPRRIFDAILMAYERFVILNVLETISHILRAATILLTLISGWGLEGIGWAELGTEIFNFGCKFAILLSMKHEFSLSLFRIHGATAWSLTGFGILTFVTVIGDTLRFNIDSAIIGRFLTMEAVGIYGVAFTLIRLLIRVSNACTVVTFPRLSQLAGRDFQDFQKNYLIYSRMSSIFITGLTLELVLLSPGFIRLWVGQAFREAEVITFILACSLATDFATTISINALKALNKLHFYAVQTIAEGICKLILSLILVRYLGIAGVALGTAIPLVINKIFIQPVYTSRLIGIDFWMYLREVLLRPAGIALPAGIGLYYSGLVLSSSFFSLALSGFLIAALFASAVIFFYLNAGERLELAGILRKYLLALRCGRKTEIRQEETL
ncbi:MAG: oligosaccharide flippase family protein [Syntrophales bacterium]